jgi:predicted house-cleaning NTP pyrophosphatase (Maf/HAM1 superfamily)
MKLPIVLGTSSVWRRQVMDSTGLVYRVEVADIDEKAITAGFEFTFAPFI